MTQISIIPETENFKVLYKAKSISLYGERIEDVVEVPQLKFGDVVMKRNFPATKSNSFHDLPEYIAVVGADMLLDKNFIYDLGADGTKNPARLILNPNRDDFSKRPFKHFDAVLVDKRFLVISVTVNTIKLKAIWDTHASTTAFSKKFIKAHSESFKLVESRRDKDASGKSGKQNFYQLLAPICIASQYCPYTIAVVIEHNFDSVENIEPFDIVLGNDFIQSFNWYFDFKAQRYFVLPR